MIVKKFILSNFQQNSRVAVCENTGTAICVDPAIDSPEIAAFIRENGYRLQAITLTHGHMDHIGGTKYMSEQFPDAEIMLHSGDEDFYYGLPHQPEMLGMPPERIAELGLDFPPPPKLTRNWQHGEIYPVGDLRFTVLHSPGHTRGHVILAEKNHKQVFVGDCLFEGSIGRTDLPGGNFAQLIDSIRTNILSLGDNFTVYSGHGNETTTGRERQTNPFLTGAQTREQGRYV